MRRRARTLLAGAFLAASGACSNDPYPAEDAAARVRYRALPDASRTLDPAVAYNALEHFVTVSLYETLLEYHYLARPYRLVPGLAAELPAERPRPGGGVTYSFRLRPDLRFQADPCFAAFSPGRETREIVAADFAFQIQRLADPALASPVFETFARIEGFREFSERLAARREGEAGFAGLPVHEQYARAGGIAGLRSDDPLALEIALREPFRQFAYWFAMPFTAPVPWEAVVWYDGREGRDLFQHHPISVGPFQIERYDRQHRIVLVRNPNWYGARHPEWRAPGAVHPEEGDPRSAGRPLPFLDRVEFRVEKELIPQFHKFMQGWYDASVVIPESFDLVVQGGELSEEMRARGVQLDRAVDLDVWYLGFNMLDPVVGAPAGERGRKLRQALSLAIDAREFTRVFLNGRGVPAQSPLPPGIFGYEEGYRNPWRQPDLPRARELLREAGYRDGLDPATGRPLRLTLDVADPSTSSRLRNGFFVKSWERLGVQVALEATAYNQYLDKTHRGAYQILFGGWGADYPDPENFLFLLHGPNGVSRSGGMNLANFSDPRFDALFLAMKDEPDGPRRLARIREMRAILERERPWIEVFHRESYALYQPWVRNAKLPALGAPPVKFEDLDPELRAALRREWNRPIRWPAFGLAAVAAALLVPAAVTFARERQ